MKKHFSAEHRLCFRDTPPDVRDGDPGWTFGDLPMDARFHFDDSDRGRTQFTKTGVTSAEARLGYTTVLKTSPRESMPVKNLVIPTIEEIRARYTAWMREPNMYFPPPQALVLAFEKEAEADAARARTAIENGGVPYGPTKNPSDQLREYVDWSTVPMGSFFCIPQNPGEEAQVFLRVAGDYVLKICPFSQWVQGFKGVTIQRKEVKLSEVLKPNSERMSQLKVNVLCALKPEEFERVLENYKARPDASPPSARNDAYHAELRRELAAFWAGVEARKLGA